MKYKPLNDLIEDYKRIKTQLTKDDSVFNLWNKERERLLRYLKQSPMDKIKDKQLKHCLNGIWDHYEDSLIRSNEFIKKDLYNDPMNLKLRQRVEKLSEVSLKDSNGLSQFVDLKDEEEVKVIANIVNENDLEVLLQDPSYDQLVNSLGYDLKRMGDYQVEGKLQELEEELLENKSKFYFLTLLTEIFVKLDHKNSRAGIKYPYGIDECLSKIETSEFEILRQELEDCKEREFEANKKLRSLEKEYMELSEQFCKFRGEFFEQIEEVSRIKQRVKGKIIDVEGMKKLVDILNSPKISPVGDKKGTEGDIQGATAFLKDLNEKLKSVEKIAEFDFMNEKELDYQRRLLFRHYSAEVKLFEKKLLNKNEPAKTLLRELVQTPTILKENIDKYKEKNIQADEIKDHFGKKYSYYKNDFKEDLRQFNEIRFDDSPLEIDLSECLVSPIDLKGNSEVFLVENSMALLSNQGNLNRIVSYGEEFGVKGFDLSSKTCLFKNFRG